MSANPIFIGTPKRGMVTIVNADASTLKTVVTAGSSGSKLVSLMATSDNTADVLLQVYVTRSGTDYLVCSATVTTLAGTNGVTTPAADLLINLRGDPHDNDGQRYQFLESGDVLKVKSTTTVVAAKTVAIHAVYGDF